MNALMTIREASSRIFSDKPWTAEDRALADMLLSISSAHTFEEEDLDGPFTVENLKRLKLAAFENSSLNPERWRRPAGGRRNSQDWSKATSSTALVELEPEEIKVPSGDEMMLWLLLPEEKRESILGDLAEAFRDQLPLMGRRAAESWYRKEALQVLRAYS